jgi:hypothetical protein
MCRCRCYAPPRRAAAPAAPARLAGHPRALPPLLPPLLAGPRPATATTATSPRSAGPAARASATGWPSLACPTTSTGCEQRASAGSAAARAPLPGHWPVQHPARTPPHPTPPHPPPKPTGSSRTCCAKLARSPTPTSRSRATGTAPAPAQPLLVAPPLLASAPALLLLRPPWLLWLRRPRPPTLASSPALPTCKAPGCLLAWPGCAHLPAPGRLPPLGQHLSGLCIVLLPEAPPADTAAWLGQLLAQLGSHSTRRRHHHLP